jgi:hypothetical protein
MALFAGAVATGCLPGLTGSDDCQSGAERCANGSVELCQKPCSEFGCGNQWTSGPLCDTHQVCVQMNANWAQCALSSQSDPQCGDSRGYCDGNVAVDCGGGYATHRKECGIDRFCALTSNGPVCALSGTTDPRCADVSGYCDGNTAVFCEGDFAVARQDCRRLSDGGVGDGGGGHACALEQASRTSPICVNGTIATTTDPSDAARYSSGD